MATRAEGVELWAWPCFVTVMETMRYIDCRGSTMKKRKAPAQLAVGEEGHTDDCLVALDTM